MSLDRRGGLVGCGGLLLASLVAGCAGDDGAASGGVTAALTVYAEVYCESLFRCVASDNDDVAWRIAFQDEATCRRVATRYLQSDDSGQGRRLRAMEAAGRLVVNDSKFEACRELGRTCTPFLDKCQDMFEGRVALGGACTASEECAGDAACTSTSQGEQCAAGGSCKARVAIGQPCRSSEDCQGGATGARMCRHLAGVSRCVEVKHEVARAGEACGHSDEGDVQRFVTCEKGLWCDEPNLEAPPGLPGTCKSPLMLGAACDDNDDICEGAAVCSLEGAESRCAKVTLLHAGEPCNAPGGLALCDVFGGFTCGESKECVALGDGSAGSRCDSTDFGELLPCNPGLRCAAESGTCEPRYAIGHTCEYDGDCASHHCDPVAQKCETEADACDRDGS